MCLNRWGIWAGFLVSQRNQFRRVIDRYFYYLPYLSAPSKDLRQWAHRGQEFFSKGLYALAVTCFELTGQVKEAAIADAYQHMSEAKFLLEDNQESRNAFIKAAEKMKTCAQSGEGNNSSHSSATLWYHAATCFEAASEASRASQSYFRGGHFNQAALVSFEAQDMDECLRVLVSYGANIETRLMSRIKDFYSVHYFGERKYRFVYVCGPCNRQKLKVPRIVNP